VFADVRVFNNGTLADYFIQVDTVMRGLNLEGIRGITYGVAKREPRETDQVYRCLKILESDDAPKTVAEITKELSRSGQPMHENNVRKTLREAPELVERVGEQLRGLKYKIRPAGIAYLRMTEQRKPRLRDSD
jgi:hypothetical protein